VVQAVSRKEEVIDELVTKQLRNKPSRAQFVHLLELLGHRELAEFAAVEGSVDVRPLKWSRSIHPSFDQFARWV
jgi:hypothetical protein